MQFGQAGREPGLPSNGSADDGDSALRDQGGGAACAPAGSMVGGQEVSPVQVIGVAREVVSHLAPRELEVFDAVADSWARGEWDSPRLRRRRSGSAVGFGIEGVLLSALVFPVISGALAQVLGSVLTEQLGRRRRKRAARAAETAAVAEPGPDGGRIVLGRLQARAFHDKCLRHALALGMPPDKAALLADACLGAVNSVDLA